MKSNNYDDVITEVGETQDGKTLRRRHPFGDKYSTFMTDVIEEHTDDGIVDVEEVISDFNYMIDQLRRALNPLTLHILQNQD